jgi:CRP-like cAMP-binding protein
MMAALESPLIRKLGAFVAISEQELSALEVFHQRRRSFDPGVDLVRQCQLGQIAYILADGWVCSYKLLASGTRQIVDFQVPGDFL